MRLQDAFRRPLPKGQQYADRFAREMRLIEKNRFEEVFLQVREILDLAPEYRHITRGSAGCSLVGYLLDIHNMDPVQHNFALSRFMHEQRPDLPDIDVDFAYNQRDEVVDRVMRNYPGRVARISNHVTYKHSSALRQALREMGHKKFLPRYFDLQQIAGDRTEAVINRAAEIEGSFKNYSLHCGGIVIFPESVPEDLKLNDTQIKLNKDEVEERGYFKIDLLCNRGLAQLNDLSDRQLDDYPPTDEATARLFKEGRAWGVTFGESPAQRKLHVDLQPSCRDDITLSLAMIRPLPSADGRRKGILQQLRQHGNHDGHMIYDDDGIYFIQNLLNCSESEAELYRKAFGKKNEQKVAEFLEKVKYHPERDQIAQELSYYGLYSFCHAHAMSYGQLVWALAYEKVRQPKKFWWSALNHAQSMYRPWVHVQEAKGAGLRFAAFGRGPWRLEGDELHPTHVEAQGNGWYQYNKRGFWISNRFMPGCYCLQTGPRFHFKGLIATGRHHTAGGRKITFLTIGYETGKYLDLVLDGLHQFERYDLVEGEGDILKNSIQVDTFELQKLPYAPLQQELFNQSPQLGSQNPSS
jgi:error-prone DNA polymerase